MAAVVAAAAAATADAAANAQTTTTKAPCGLAARPTAVVVFGSRVGVDVCVNVNVGRCCV
jgi:hypothetical protein